MEIQEKVAFDSSRVGLPPLISLLCLAASVALLLPLEAVEEALGGSSRLAWCALFWVAILSIPQASGGSASWSVGLGIGLCVLGLAAHLDLSLGADAKEVWSTGWPTLLFSVLLAGAASRARETKSTERHLLLWFVLVLGVPLFAHTLGQWGGVQLPAWIEFIASASPLDWLAGRAGGDEAEPWLPLGVSVLLFLSTAASGSDKEVAE